MKPTFDNLPEEIHQLRKDVDELKKLLKSYCEKDQPISHDKPFSVDEAAEYLDLSKQTVYIKTSKGELPVIKLPNSKRNYYMQQDLLDYLKNNRRKSNSEIKSEAANHLNPKRK